MQIKQFTGGTVDEVLRQIRAELGDDAVILQTRRVVRGGIGGFFGRELIEVTAAEGAPTGGPGDIPPAATALLDRPTEPAAPAAPPAQANRSAAASVLDVRDEDEAGVFSRHLQGRLAAALEAEADRTMDEVARAASAGPAAAPANVYAMNAETAAAAAPPQAPPEAPAPVRPFAPGTPDRTQAIVEAAREAMRQARAARDEHAAPAAAPARLPGQAPPPPSFIPAGQAAPARAVPAAVPAAPAPATPPPAPAPADPPGAPVVRTPVWERIDAATAAAAPLAPAVPVVPAAPAVVPAAAPVEATPPAPAPAAAPAVPVPVVTIPAPEAVQAPVVVTVPAPAPEATPVPVVTVPAPAPEAVPAPVVVAADPAAERLRRLEAVRGELLGGGVEPRYLDPLLDGFTRTAMPFMDEGEDVRDAVRAWLAARLPVARDWKARPAGAVMAFVGEAGVGKTTAVAKLAWRLHTAGRTVAVVSAGRTPDPVLEALAARLGVRLVVAGDGDALAAARAELAGHDVVLVDTPGISAQRLGDMEALGALLSAARPEEVHLVLPVTAHVTDLGDLARRFRIAGVNRLVLTRLDETRFLGNLVNVPMRMSKPLALLAEGPAVPGALAPADGAEVAEMLLP